MDALVVLDVVNDGDVEIVLLNEVLILNDKL